MSRLLKSPLAAILASGVLLTGVLLHLVVDRVRLLANGQEIVVRVFPVDPRDFFKGDYARLQFDISQLPADVRSKLSPRSDAGAPRPAVPTTVYVTLGRNADGAWTPVDVTQARPAGVGPDRVVLKGKAWLPDADRVAYGIERYYVPEGKGPHIEELARRSALSAILAVDSAGRAAIKGLVIEGRRVYEEPLL